VKRRGNHSRALTKTQLRARYAEDRRKGKILQKKGLISARANLTRAKPSLAVRKKIASLEGVLDGRSQAVEITDVMAPKYKRAGYRVIGRKVILDKSPGQKFVRDKSDIILVDEGRTGGFESVLIPFDIRSIQQFVDWIREDPDQLMALLPPGTAFAFTYQGNNSRHIFTDPLELADYLEHYNPEGWQHFVLYRLISPRDWIAGASKPRLKRSSQDRRYKASSKTGQNQRYYQHNKTKIKNKNARAYAALKARLAKK
jgi:hypothetical protein